MSCKDEQHLSPICTVKRLMQAHYSPDTNAQEQEPTAGPSAESTLRADLLHLLSIPQKLQLPPLKGYATSHELASSDARKLFDLATPGPSQLTSSKAVSDWLVRLKNGVEQLLAGQENSLKALARGIKRKGTTVHDNEASKRHNWPGSDVVDGGLSYPLLRRVIISALLKADMERAAQGAPVWDQSTQHAAMDLAIQVRTTNTPIMQALG